GNRFETGRIIPDWRSGVDDRAVAFVRFGRQSCSQLQMLSGIGAVRGARFRTGSRAKSPMTERQQQLEFLIQVGTLLLEYNESSGGIIHALTSTARTFGDEPCHVSVTYLSVTVSFADEPPVLRSVQELRL